MHNIPGMDQCTSGWHTFETIGNLSFEHILVDTLEELRCSQGYKNKLLPSVAHDIDRLVHMDLDDMDWSVEEVL